MTNEIYTTQTEEEVTTVTTETETTETETTDIIIDATSTENNTIAVSSSGSINEQLNIPLTYKGERSIGSWLSQPYEEDEVGDVRYVPPLDQHYVLLKHEMNGWKVLPLLEAGRDIESMILPVNNVKDAKFGAEGDGEFDDTDAIQAALDSGGIVYFPPGRYRVTKELKALTPCTIVMERMYPSCSGADYPEEFTTEDVNPDQFGARIETSVSVTDDGSLPCGLTIGDGVNVDGLAIRAMEGFRGVVLKYDGTQGKHTYPSQTRLKHIRVDCQNQKVIPVCMFDFAPCNTYGAIVEDVMIGGNYTRQLCYYGFRSSLPGVGWANSIRIKDVLVDIHAAYPFYINGLYEYTDDDGIPRSLKAQNWVLSNVVIQTCEFDFEDKTDENGNIITDEEGKSSEITFTVDYDADGDGTAETITLDQHICAVYLRNMDNTYINGCYVWDVEKAAIRDNVVISENVTNITAVGNDEYFDALDTVIKLPAKRVKDIAYDHILEVGNGRTVPAGNNMLNPKMRTLTQENVALPGEADGQFIPYDFKHDGCINGAILADPQGYNSTWYKEGLWTSYGGYWTTSLIPCGRGDIVRFYYYADNNWSDNDTDDETATQRYLAWRKGLIVCEYDESGATCLRRVGDKDGKGVSAEYTVTHPDTEFIRVSFYGGEMYGVAYDDRVDYLMATVNYPVDIATIRNIQGHYGANAANYVGEDTAWAALTGIERYSEETTPGLLSQLTLISSSGKKYRLSVLDDNNPNVVLMPIT